MSDWLLIVGMAIVTFLPRYIPFALAGKVTLPDWLSEALSFVPIAVLTTIVVRASLFRENELLLVFDNHNLVAAVVAFVVALFSKHLFLTVGLGLLSFGLLEFFF